MSGLAQSGTLPDLLCRLRLGLTLGGGPGVNTAGRRTRPRPPKTSCGRTTKPAQRSRSTMCRRSATNQRHFTPSQRHFTANQRRFSCPLPLPCRAHPAGPPAAPLATHGFQSTCVWALPIVFSLRRRLLQPGRDPVVLEVLTNSPKLFYVHNFMTDKEVYPKTPNQHTSLGGLYELFC